MSNLIKVYFDACCFIDMAQIHFGLGLEKGRNSHAVACKSFIDAARASEAVVITSTLTLVECVCVKDFSKTNGDSKYKIMTDEVKQLFNGMIMSGKSGVLPWQPDPRITKKATDLAFENGLTCGAMDKIHIATALMSNCTHFVTTDELNSKNAKENLGKVGLTVCTADTIAYLLPDRYRQLELNQFKEIKKMRGGNVTQITK